MVFYHNSLAQVMGSMGLVGIVAYGRLLHDRIALLRQGEPGPLRPDPDPVLSGHVPDLPV